MCLAYFPAGCFECALNSYFTVAEQIATNLEAENKTHLFTHKTVGQMSRWAQWVACLESHNAEINLPAVLGSQQEAPRKNSFRLLAESMVHKVVELKPLFPSWLLAGGHYEFFRTSFQPSYLPRPSQKPAVGDYTCTCNHPRFRFYHSSSASTWKRFSAFKSSCH